MQGNSSKWKGSKLIWSFSVLYLCGVFLTLVTAQQFTDEELIVKVPGLGTIRGDQLNTFLNQRPYVRFRGIPYGKAPVGSKRFLPPEPADIPLAPEGQIFNATRTSPCCAQPTSYRLCAFTQGEDCLKLTVYTPAPPSRAAKLLPVIVFIHGGAFTAGADSIYNGARLLEERDVILVTFNYRLGALGFFSLNTKEAPGNAAMYDMLEALKWVKKYIHYFGGNQNLITITGQSAGSAAVSHLMTSPLTKGKDLFHRVIAASGTVLNEWGTTTNEKGKAASLEIAQLVNCYDPAIPTPENEILACMHKVPASQLAAKLDDYQVKENNAGRLGFEPASPMIQTVAPDGYDIFVPKNPEEVLEKNEEENVPLMTGSTRHDGSFVLALVYSRYLKHNGLIEDEAFLKAKLVPALLKSLGIPDKTGAVVDALANKFLGKEVRNSGNLTVMLPGLTDMFTVFFFKAATFRTLELHSRLNKQSYWYNFDFQGTKSVFSTLIPDPTNPVKGGVGHGDDLIYLFGIPYQTIDLPEEIAVSKKMVDYWVNFAYSGNPNSEEIGSSFAEEFMLAKRIPQADAWPVFSEDKPNFAIIDSNDEFIAEYPNDYWVGASAQLYPELQPDPATTEPTTEIAITTPFIDIDTQETDETTESTTEEITTTTTTTEATTSSTTEDSSTSEETTISSSSTTDDAPASQQASYVLLVAATITCLLQAMR